MTGKSKLKYAARMNKPPADLITTAEARKILGISPIKMAELIKSGAVTTYPNPLDRRFKLISRADLKPYMPFRRRAA